MCPLLLFILLLDYSSYKNYSSKCLCLCFITVLFIIVEINHAETVHVSLFPHVTDVVPGLGFHVERQYLVMNIGLVIRASCESCYFRKVV